MKAYGKVLAFCIGGALLAGLTAYLVVSIRETPPADTVAAEAAKLREAEKLRLAEAKLRADVELRFRKFEGDLSALAERYRKMLPLADAEKAFQESLSGAKFLSGRDGLCGFKTCVSLAYKMAYDKLKGTARAAEAIEPLVQERICKPMEGAIGAYAKWADDYRGELQAQEQALALDLAVVADAFNDEISVLANEDAVAAGAAIDGFVASSRSIAMQTACAAAGVAVEAAMAKASYAAIKKTAVRIASRALASSAAKAGASAATGAACAVADGPLPIGDAIGTTVVVAGLLWTAYDIYDVTRTMPDEMLSEIESEISKTKSALADAALDNLEKGRAACLAAAQARVDEIAKSLEGGKQ